MIAKTGGYVNPIPTNYTKDVTLDFQVPSAPNVTDNALALGVKGNFFYERDAEPWGERAPQMPWNDPTAKPKFQARISNYAVDGLVKSIIDENPDFTLNITYAYLKANTALYVDTEIANFIMPGISALYGSGIPMDVLVNVRELRGLHSTKDGLFHLMTNINLKFLVEQKDAAGNQIAPVLAADMEVVDAHGTFNITMNDTACLNFDIKGFNFTEIEANYASFGVTYNQFMKDALNVLFDPRGYILPWINNNPPVSKGICIPTTIAKIFKLTAVTLDWFDDFALVGATPVFIKPNATSTLFYDGHPEVVNNTFPDT